MVSQSRAIHTPGGKPLLVGPGWQGEKPDGFIDVLHSATAVAGLFGRSFTAHSPEDKARARRVLNQIGVYPLSEDTPERKTFDCEASARNKVYPAGVTAEMLERDPDLLRIRPVDAGKFWDDLKKCSMPTRSSGRTMRPWRNRRAQSAHKLPRWPWFAFIHAAHIVRKSAKAGAQTKCALPRLQTIFQRRRP